MPNKILISDGIDKEIFERLKKSFDVHPETKLSRKEVLKLVPEFEGLVIRSATNVDRELLTAAKHLKYVIRAGEGTDNIDKGLCRELGVKVSNTPGANNNSAAEHAVALILSLLRNIPRAHASTAQGKWEKSLFLGSELGGKTVGIVGMGRIGQLVAKRISGFDPEILYFDPVVESLPLPHAKKVNDIHELFSSADVVSIHAPKIKETLNLVGKRELSAMKKSAVLVNAARGGIVNEKDLVEILQAKKIAGAALDVFEEEPLPSNSPLLKLDNVILTPHLGASTEEAQARVGAMVFEQLIAFFEQGEHHNEA